MFEAALFLEACIQSQHCTFKYVSRKLSQPVLENTHQGKKKNMILNPRSCVRRTSLASSSGIPVYQGQHQVAHELNGCPVCQTLWRWTATKLAEHVFHRQIGQCHCHRGKQTLPHCRFWLIEIDWAPLDSNIIDFDVLLHKCSAWNTYRTAQLQHPACEMP